MKVKRIVIHRFKSLQHVDLATDDINIIIGGNNSGKSSLLQAIQFSTSIVQTIITINHVKFNSDELSTTISSDQLLYSPARDVLTLAYGADELTQVPDKSIQIEFYLTNDNNQEISAIISIRRGKNKNLSVSLIGREACSLIGSLEQPFSMYVPGLAGIPFSEDYKALGAIRRAAAKGDSNTILRNVLFQLSKEPRRFDDFISFLRRIFPMIDIKIITHLEIDGSIDVLVNQDGITKPIDSIGTGVLQSIQVAAYTFYFQPRLLLLDEPDSHLHPNNQKVLAGLIQLLTNSSGNQIVLATHSRQLLSSLRKCSSTTLMKNGRSEEYRDEYDILLEIGALDNFDLIKNPNVNYLILTEDSAPESIDMLKIILLSSGYDINEFMIVSYAGVSNINFAKLAANCIQLLRESLTVIIHRDRDSLYDDEVENLVGEIEKNPSTYCFVTKYSDLEMYFCKPQHISEHLLQLNLSELVAPNEVADIVADAINQVSELSSEKFMNRRIDGSNQNRAREARKATDYFTSNKIRCSYGKGVIGRIRNALQDRLARNISLVSVSMFLEDQYLVKIKEER